MKSKSNHRTSGGKGVVRKIGLSPVAQLATSQQRAADEREQFNAKYPEHAKLKAVAGRSNECGSFIDWLAGQKIVLGSFHYHGPTCPGWDADRGRYNPDVHNQCAYGEGELVRISDQTEDLLARRFDIDRNVLLAEKDAMLNEVRAANLKLHKI